VRGSLSLSQLASAVAQRARSHLTIHKTLVDCGPRAMPDVALALTHSLS